MSPLGFALQCLKSRFSTALFHFRIKTLKESTILISLIFTVFLGTEIDLLEASFTVFQGQWRF